MPSPLTGLSSGRCMGSINRRNTLTSQGSNALFRLSNCPIVFNRRFCTRREPTCICISRVGAGLVVARDACQFPVNIVEERHVMLTQSISTAPLTMLKRSVYGLADHTTKWLPRSISRWLPQQYLLIVLRLSNNVQTAIQAGANMPPSARVDRAASKADHVLLRCAGSGSACNTAPLYP